MLDLLKTSVVAPIATALLIALAAPDAKALSRFDIVSTTTSLGNPLDALVVGETVTIGIRISESENVYALSASAWNYDESVLDFVSGRAVPVINYADCFASPVDLCFPPFLTNTLPSELVENNFAGHGNRVPFISAATLDSTSSNPLDPGLDGVIGGGDAQFRLSFVATGLGSTTVIVGYGYPSDGESMCCGGSGVETSARTPVPITVVPEPGTALLLGQGLAGLAVSRRPRSTARSRARARAPVDA